MTRLSLLALDIVRDRWRRFHGVVGREILENVFRRVMGTRLDRIAGDHRRVSSLAFGLGKHIGFYQKAPVLDPFHDVDFENYDRRPPDSGLANQHRSVPLEVVIPPIRTRIEETNKGIGVGIIPRDVRPFVSVAE